MLASVWRQLDEACLRAFGKDIVYSPEDGDPFALTGILDTGARPEDAAPGTYAVLFVRATDFSQPPARGDEVTVGGSVYKVIDLEADAEGGMRLVLHFSRQG